MYTCEYCGDEFMNSDEFMAHMQVHAMEQLNRVLAQQKDSEGQNQAFIELSRRIQDSMGSILAQRPHYSQEVLAIARLSLEPNMNIDKAIALCDDVKERLDKRPGGN